MKKTNTVKAFAWSFLEQAGSKAVSVIVQIVLARLLAPEAFGVLAILLVVTNIADAIAQSGLGMSLIQKKDSDSHSFSTAFWLSLGVSIVLYAAIVFSADALASFYAMPDLAVYLRVLGIAVVFNSMNSIQRAYLQKQLNFKALFRINILAVIASGVLGVLVAVLGGGVWALVLQVISYSMFVFVMMVFMIDWKPSRVFDTAEAKTLFSYGWKICVTGVLNVLYSGISELVVGRACSVGDLGLYSQGRKYPQVAIGAMTNSIANVLFPMFSIVKDDKKSLVGAIKRSLMLGTFIVAPISLLAAVVSEPLVALLLTEKWLMCVPIFQLTCLSSSLLMLQLVNLRAYMALGDSALYMRLQILKVLGGGMIIWVTAAVTRDIYMTAMANFLVGFFSVLFVDMPPAKRVHGYSAICQIRDVFPIFALSLIAAAASLFIQLLQLGYGMELVVQCAVFVSVYLLGARLFGFKELSETARLIRDLLVRKG